MAHGAFALIIIAVWAFLQPAAARAQASAYQAEGWGPDAQLTGGVGFGIPERLRNPFLGRVRLGALYAREPWSGSAGLTCELGALGKVGFGAELELDTWSGWFAELGLARVSDERFQTHVTLGFTVLGLEWQHRFAAARPSDALLLEVRLPLGLWWFMSSRKAAEKAAAQARAGSNERAAMGPLPVAGISSQPLAAEQVAGSHAPKSMPGPSPEPRVLQPNGAPGPSGTDGVPRSIETPNLNAAGTSSGPNAIGAAAGPASIEKANPATNPPPSAAEAAGAVGSARARSKEADAALTSGAAASARGDFSQASLEFSRAYAFSPEPAILLQLSAAEEAQGGSRQAAADLRRYLASTALTSEQRSAAQARLLELERRTPKLRLRLSGGHGDEVLALDAEPEPSLALGYDAPLDPGAHELSVSRAGRELARQRFSAKPGELVRLDIVLP